MEAFNFDRQFRLMELADIRAYIGADPVRRAEWKMAIARWHDRSMIELATFKELMGLPVSA